MTVLLCCLSVTEYSEENTIAEKYVKVDKERVSLYFFFVLFLFKYIGR